MRIYCEVILNISFQLLFSKFKFYLDNMNVCLLQIFLFITEWVGLCSHIDFKQIIALNTFENWKEIQRQRKNCIYVN
jgi:hypothetical protein